MDMPASPHSFLIPGIVFFTRIIKKLQIMNANLSEARSLKTVPILFLGIGRITQRNGQSVRCGRGRR